MASCVDHPHRALATCPHCEIATLRALLRRAVPYLNDYLLTKDHTRTASDKLTALIAEANDG